MAVHGREEDGNAWQEDKMKEKHGRMIGWRWMAGSWHKL